MARIRTIKPEFPQSESMGRVSRDARLLFILLWTLSDDAGRSRGNSRILASLLFPYDTDSVEFIDGWIGELEAEGCVLRYSVGVSTYIQCLNWLKHQKIDKASPSKLPAPPENSFPPLDVSSPPRESSPPPREPSSWDLGPRTLEPRKGKEEEQSSVRDNLFPDVCGCVRDAVRKVQLSARDLDTIRQWLTMFSEPEIFSACVICQERGGTSTAYIDAILRSEHDKKPSTPPPADSEPVDPKWERKYKPHYPRSNGMLLNVVELADEIERVMESSRTCRENILDIAASHGWGDISCHLEAYNAKAV